MDAAREVQDVVEEEEDPEAVFRPLRLHAREIGAQHTTLRHPSILFLFLSLGGTVGRRWILLQSSQRSEG